VVSGGCLGLSDHEMIEFLVRGEVKRGASKTTTMEFWRADTGLFRTLVERVRWERVLKGKVVQEGWDFFKDVVLKVQEQAFLMCCKTNRWGRQPAWLNRELLLGLRKKRGCTTYGRKGRRCKRSTVVSLGHAERKLERQKPS